jgi:hypothetical protein
MAGKEQDSGKGLRGMRGGTKLLEPCGNCGCRRYSKCTCMVGMKKDKSN